jgi:CubicO group peptidase (beta-lactamase class C family)
MFIGMERGAEVFEELERFINAELACRGHPGSSVAVVMEGEVVWSKGFGHADVERGIQATPGTVYRCASVTKPVVTFGLLQLKEGGSFSLDDPVDRYLEELRNPFERRPTIRDLLTHYSGMPTRVPPLFRRSDEAPSLRDYIAGAARVVRPPGEGWAYCNTAYAIVGYLIELFSGEPYDVYVRDHVLRPLEMDMSGFEPTPEMKASLATGYSRDGGPERPLERVEHYIIGTRPQDPAGSLYSTVIDLSKFLICNLDKGLYKGRRVLGEETVEEMHRLQRWAGGSRSGMALTWFRSIHAGHVMLSHTGGLPGFTNHVAFYKDLGIGISWLSNLNDGSGWRPPAPTALRIIAGEPAPVNPNRFQRIPEGWAGLIGAYGEAGQRAEVRAVNGYLLLDMMGERAFLEEVEGPRYIVHGSRYDGYELTFELDERGKAEGFEIENMVLHRLVEERRAAKSDADLRGHWRGEYVHTYGFYTLELKISDELRGSATDMAGGWHPIDEFRAERGEVRGSYRFKPPEEYALWGAGEFRVELELYATGDDRMRGRMTFIPTRTMGRYTTDVELIKIRP